ncbi:juvenile hormone epoxide hydrolase 1-like isoform X1 [Chrysoperla carnea]|uniref:juvenile hormone epoxide hydrolase 1-like isoform X1 n=1 Tax=Chrysoperla carnea TaxID=189513 RepID=UPI001D082834|nr:juvenile hormone epoxide hydrolase 1-like isoform X1 [Chrysoperla carnea]
MSLASKLVLIILSVFIVFVAYSIHSILQPPKLDKPLPETWWTDKDPKDVDESIQQFSINIDETVLEDLYHRLDLFQEHTLPLQDANFTYGFNTDYLYNVIDFWRNQYDWRQREKFLNQYPHFITNVQGLDIHFMHIKPKITKNVKVLPLLLLHGWPGSIREFYRAIPLLITPRDGYVFEVIVPSLPGYGFSEGATKKGLGSSQVAVVMKNLMLKLGFKKFVVQGGDWGGVIAQNIATLFPENLIGMHSNMCSINTPATFLLTLIGSVFPRLVVEKEYEHLIYPYSSTFKHLLEESGYMHLQATKPDTIGIALRESPVGLAAYIMEKFSTWTDKSWKHLPDGGLTRKFTLTELLDNVMIYWVTGSITTSVRLYAETFSIAHLSLNIENIPTNVPSACVKFPNELLYQPNYLLSFKFYNLIQTTHFPRGGHFAAFEEPDLLVDDVFLFVKKLNV